jgi:hypothetical protein
VSEPNELERLLTEIMDCLEVPETAEVQVPMLEDDARERVNPIEIRLAERKAIQNRVAQFKAHQLRWIKERETYVAAELLRMRASPEEASSRSIDHPAALPPAAGS